MTTMTPTETPAPDSGYVLTDDQIRHMVNRFLAWRLPEDFSPDGGITFKAEFNAEYMASLGKPPMRHEPQGTNLLDARQAEAMVRHMVAGLPLGRVEVPGDHPLAQALRPSPECLAEIRDMEAQNAANVRALLRGESDAGRAAPEGGYVLVPREPSEAMMRAPHGFDIPRLNEVSVRTNRDIYLAMIAAAPSPAPEGEVEEVVGRLERAKDDGAMILTWPWPALCKLAADAITLIRRLQAEREGLHLAICGGEDAPGYAASLTHEQVLQVVADNHATMRRDSQLAWDGETAQSWKSRALKAEAERDAAVKRAEDAREALLVAREGLSIAAGWARGKPDNGRARDKIKGGLDAIRRVLNPRKAALQPQGAEHG